MTSARASVWFSTLNRWIAGALLLLAIGIAAVGIYLGVFAWLNDGAKAGLKLILTTLAFGAGSPRLGSRCGSPRPLMRGMTPTAGGSNC